MKIRIIHYSRSALLRFTKGVEDIKATEIHGVRVIARVSLTDVKAYFLIPFSASDDHRFPPKVFDSPEALRVYLRLIQGEP